MKKIIALALALIMALSMASVAFAAATPAPAGGLVPNPDGSGVHVLLGATARPGEAYEVNFGANGLNGDKITKVDFTTGDLCGASLIDSVKITKEKDAIRITLKESYTMALEEAKAVLGEITLKNYGTITVGFAVNNATPAELSGVRKAADVAYNEIASAENTVYTMDEEGGYVGFTVEELKGAVKMNKEEKVYFNLVTGNDVDADTKDAIEEYLGEDFDAIVEFYQFETRAFKNEVEFRYNAYAEDPHFFYVWDGEKLVDLGAKYDDDEDVDDYVWTAVAEGTIVVTDEEVVLAAEETKNPDTGANDVVGVAAALAVVSLVAAGAVSLKK